MRRDSWVFKRKSTILYLLVSLVWLITTLMQIIFVDQTQITQFGVSPEFYRMVIAIVSVPLLVIWLVLTFAIISFNSYSENIKNSPDAPGFLNVAYGLTVLLVSSFGTNLLTGYSAISAVVSSDPLTFQTQMTIASNYLSAVSSVFMYWFFLKGGLALLKINKAKIAKKVYVFFVGLPVAVFAALYILLIFANPDRYYSSNIGTPATFGLPDPLIFGTVVLPMVVAWLFGAASIAAYYTYLQKTKGLIYKPLFKNFVIGVGVFVITSVVFQISTQFSDFWSSISLEVALLILSFIYVLLIFSFGFIGRAAQNLNKIEIITEETLIDGKQ